MADTPPWAGPVPVLITGAYQTKQFNAGLAGGTETVFDALADPPEYIPPPTDDDGDDGTPE